MPEPVEAHLAEVLAAIRPLQPARARPGRGRGRRARRGRHGQHRRCRRSTTRPWTVTPSTPPTGRGASEATRSPCRCAGEIAAGDTASLTSGRRAPALRIMTGALLPAGADAVVPVEWTDGGTGQVARSAGRSPRATRSGDRATTSPRERRAADGGHPARPGPARRCSRPPGRARSWPAPRPRVAVIVDRQRAQPSRARRWSPARSGSPTASCSPRRRGRPARWPTGTGCRDDPDAVLAADRGAAAAGRPADHQRRGEHGRRARRRQGGAVRAGHGRRFRKVAMQPGMPQGFGVLGPARRRSSPCPATRSARTSRSCCSSAPALRALQGLPTERQCPARVPPSPSRCAHRQGRRSFLRGMLDAAAGDGHPADRPGLAPAGRAGPGQRADHRAGAGDRDGSGRPAST